jgi:hypothetical protein
MATINARTNVNKPPTIGFRRTTRPPIGAATKADRKTALAAADH